MKKVLFRIFIVLVILVIIVNIFSIFNLSFFGFRTFRIGSGSMDPYLKVNDFIVIHEEDSYKANDVVTYINSSNSYVTHRIIYIDDIEVVTKGDANNTKDTPFEPKDIVGKVVFRVRGLGFVMYLFSNYTSWILLFIIGLGITMIIPDKEEVNIEERRDSDASEENNSNKEDNNKESARKETKKTTRRKTTKTKASSKKTTKTISKKGTSKRSSTKTRSRSSTKAKKTLKKEVYCIPFIVCTILHFVL